MYPSDARWSDRLFEALPNAESGPVAGSSTIIANRDEKRAIYLSSGAFVADMESHVVAQIAAEHCLPFAILRVVADPSTLTLTARCGERPQSGWLAEHSGGLEIIGDATEPAMGHHPHSRRDASRDEKFIPLPPASGPGLGGADLG